MTLMNKRYKITRLDDAGSPTLTLEECQQFFATQPDVQYTDAFSVTQDGVNMKIAGHFFMWHVGNASIPFRFYDGELYVAIAHDAVYDKMLHIARSLEAMYVEG